MAEKYTGYALRFISGKYQGNEYPLPANREIIIGRGSELDIVLVEDMISRRHAKIVTGDDYVILQDLGSTNGSFVNGERIRKSRIQEGDRILIGTSILKLVPYKGDPLLASGSTSEESVVAAPSHPSLDKASQPAISLAPPQQQQATMHLAAFNPAAMAPPSLGGNLAANAQATNLPSLGVNAPVVTPQSNAQVYPGSSSALPGLSPSSASLGGAGLSSQPEIAGTPSAAFSVPSMSGMNQVAQAPHLPETSQENLYRAAPDLGPPSMTGALKDTPLPDLLELFANSRKNGVLVIKSSKEGRLHFRDGIIVYAVLDNNVTIPPLKAAFRILSWKQGNFQLHPPYDEEIQQPMREDALELMQQAQHQNEQLKRYLNELPNPIHNLSVQMPLRAPLRDLRPEYLDTIQLIYNYGILDTILNKSTTTDLESYKQIVYLYKHGYIKVH